MKNRFFIPTDEASAILEKYVASKGIPKKFSRQQLHMRRKRGNGPKYVKFGSSVYYEHKSLIEWADSQLRDSDA